MLIKTKADKFFIKNLLTSLLPSYYKTRTYIKKTEFLDKERLRSIQFDHIKSVLYNSNKNIPYYRRMFRNIGFHPDDFRKIEDIELLPFMDKTTYRQNVDELISKRALKKLLPKVYTGGTTGTPLLLYRSFGDYGRERAFTEYAYKMSGVDHSSKKVYMRGKVADEIGRYHQFSDFGRTLYLSSHSLTDGQLESYIRQIRKFEPQLLYTLPSVATVLAGYMEKKSIPHFESLKWVFCPSENLYDHQKATIEKVFKCKTGTFYGHAEHAVFATKCTKSTFYHILPQYGYCELIDANRKVIRKEGLMGEIVGTAFTNSVSPLIRYRTGDFGMLSREKCACGREYMMLSKLQGREQYVAVAKNGTRISIGPELLCTIHDKSYGKIKRFRIEQHKVGILEIFLETHNYQSISEAGGLFQHLFEKTYPGLYEVKIQNWENNGKDKHLYFLQHLKDIV